MQSPYAERVEKRREPQPDEIELIMQQMQTLNVEKNEVEIHPVDEKTKIRLLRWMIDDVKLLGSQIGVPKLL